MRRRSLVPAVLPGLVLLMLSACGGVAPGASPNPGASTPQLPYGTVPAPAGSGSGAGGTSAAASAPVPASPQPALANPAAMTSAATAVTAGLTGAPPTALAALRPDNAAAALAAFRLSCPTVQRRADTSGLTQPGDWSAACAAATGWPVTDAVRFFTTHFTPVQVGDGRAYVTGYFEPEIAGSREQRPGYTIPVYRLPHDLVEVDLGLFAPDLAQRRLRGRLDGNRLVPYADRTAIDGGALAGRGLEIAWVADAPEFFFLQVQGSGRLRLPDGGVMRIGYGGQNGHAYVGIGRYLRDQGELAPGQASMQGIIAYLRADPVRGAAVMRANPSYIFFRELTGPGPLGALGLPVTPRASVAADPNFIPLGAPVLLSMDRAEPNGLWIAQDTGGAIKGANRVDTFWGAGADAAAIAGGMSARGSALLLLPHASAARLTATP